MNINVETRGYLAQNLSREEFIKYVSSAIEQQLKEWNDQYEVFLIKFKKYVIMIKNDEQYYDIKLSENELDVLQKSGPFDLDQKIWKELERQELPIIRGVGNYIETVLSEE